MRNFSRSGRRSNKTYNGGTEGSRRGGGRVDVRLWTVVLMIFRSGTCTRRRQCRWWWRWWWRVRCTGRSVGRWRILQGWTRRGQRICLIVLEFQQIRDPTRIFMGEAAGASRVDMPKSLQPRQIRAPMPTVQVFDIRRVPVPAVPRAITALTPAGLLPPLGPQAMRGPVSHAITALELGAACCAKGVDTSMTLILHGN